MVIVFPFRSSFYLVRVTVDDLSMFRIGNYVIIQRVGSEAHFLGAPCKGDRQWVYGGHEFLMSILMSIISHCCSCFKDIPIFMGSGTGFLLSPPPSLAFEQLSDFE